MPVAQKSAGTAWAGQKHRDGRARGSSADSRRSDIRKWKRIL